MTTGATPFRTESPRPLAWPVTATAAGTAIALALAPVATGLGGRRAATPARPRRARATSAGHDTVAPREVRRVGVTPGRGCADR